MAYQNPVDGPRIVPYGEDRLASDVLPNGHKGFRVTQRFADINPAFPQFGQHGAMDVGNYVGGDRVLAMAAGTVDRRYTDSAGALVIRILHSNAETTLYAHLARQSVTLGQKVAEGQQIGTVGNTGLGAVYHLHVELRRNGVKVDPWLELRQNQLPDTSLPEDDMNPVTDIPVGKATIGPVTVYADKNRTTRLIDSWNGGTNIPTYWTVLPPFPSPTPLVPVRLNMNGPTKPPLWKVGWVGADKVTPI